MVNATKVLGLPSHVERTASLSRINQGLAVAIGDNDLSRASHLIAFGAQLHMAARVGTAVTPELLPLFRSVMTGSVEMTRLIIDAGADVAQKTPNGLTALHWAASGSMVEHCKLLIERGADVEARDTFGNVPLHFAARDQEFAAVPVLLENGAQLDRRDDGGKTALHHAAVMDRIENVRELMRMGLSLDDVPSPAPAGYNTPFQSAVGAGADKMVRFLVEEHGERLDQLTIGGLGMVELAVSESTRNLLLSLMSERAVGGVLDTFPALQSSSRAAGLVL